MIAATWDRLVAAWDRIVDACDVDRIDLDKLTQDEPMEGDQ